MGRLSDERISTGSADVTATVGDFLTGIYCRGNDVIFSGFKILRSLRRGFKVAYELIL